MAASKDFVLWFLQNLPDFLMSEPISYFLGFAYLFVVVKLFHRIMYLGGKRL